MGREQEPPPPIDPVTGEPMEVESHWIDGADKQNPLSDAELNRNYLSWLGASLMEGPHVRGSKATDRALGMLLQVMGENGIGMTEDGRVDPRIIDAARNLGWMINPNPIIPFRPSGESKPDVARDDSFDMAKGPSPETLTDQLGDITRDLGKQGAQQAVYTAAKDLATTYKGAHQRAQWEAAHPESSRDPAVLEGLTKEFGLSNMATQFDALARNDGQLAMTHVSNEQPVRSR